MKKEKTNGHLGKKEGVSHSAQIGATIDGFMSGYDAGKGQMKRHVLILLRDKNLITPADTIESYRMKLAVIVDVL